MTKNPPGDFLMELLKTAPGSLGTTEAFTEALKCMNADKEVQRSIVVPLVDIPYEFVEVVWPGW